MNILDALIIVLLLVGVLSGIRRGLIKETVLLIGLIAALVFAFYLRVPISTFMYKNLPFFTFKGLFKGVSALNILLYELVAFLLVFVVLYLIILILSKISGFIEKILKATIILGFFSKIGGAIIGFIEFYIVIFIMLFIFKQPFIKISGIEESKYADLILEKTPLMSPKVSNINNAVNDIYALSKHTKDENFNDEIVEVFIKYNIVTEENVLLLKEKGKL